MSLRQVSNIDEATLSNCGEILKLFTYQAVYENTLWPEQIASGYGNNGEDETMDNPHPSPKNRVQFTD